MTPVPFATLPFEVPPAPAAPLGGPRSPLYHLAPQGLGTAQVESLSSYLCRLAEAHHLPPRVLVYQAILPYWTAACQANPAEPAFRDTWISCVGKINGTGAWARLWTQALAALTLRADLEPLTLRPWRLVLPHGGRTLRRTRAWCPACYAAGAPTPGGIYDRLLWALAPVRWCPLHAAPLQDRCPAATCGRAQPVLGGAMRPGHCAYCFAWLGETGSAAAAGPVPGAEGPGPEPSSQWTAQVLGDLLAAAPGLPAPLPRDTVAQHLRAYQRTLPGGTPQALAAHLDLFAPQVADYLRSRHLPNLGLLVRICYRLGTAPLPFLTDPPPSGPQDPAPANDPRRAILEAALLEQPPPSLRTVLARTGDSLCTGRAVFPELCARITARHRPRDPGPAGEAPRRARPQELLDSAEVQAVLGAALAQVAPLRLATVAARVGYPVATLQRTFPQECAALLAREQATPTREQLAGALQAALTEDPPPSVAAVARRLAYPISHLRWHFPALCAALVARAPAPTVAVLRERLAAVLAASGRPPALKQVAQQVGSSPVTLQARCPQEWAALVARRRDPRFEAGHLRDLLTTVLQTATDAPPSLSTVARQLGYTPLVLRRTCPDLCAAIRARYAAYRREQAALRLACQQDEVCAVTRQLHAEGLEPTQIQVGRRLAQPWILRRAAVHRAWRETIQALRATADTQLDPAPAGSPAAAAGEPG